MLFLVLETGNWLEMCDMNHGRTESQFLVALKNNGDILAIGGSDSLIVEKYVLRFNFWMEIPEWSLPKKLSGHCTVALNEFQVMVIGKAIKIWLILICLFVLGPRLLQ